MNNITNTMCRLSDLTQEEYERLREEMPYGQFDFGDNEPYIGESHSNLTLAELNDDESYTFSQIADFIESEPQGLLV
jgi:hypothetical protein